MHSKNDKNTLNKKLIDAVQQAGLQQSVQGLQLVATLHPQDDKAIHDLRVVTKRLRAYWQLLAPDFKSEVVFLLHNERLKNSARLLAQLRESHVNRKLVQAFIDDVEDTEQQRDLQELLVLLPKASGTEEINHAYIEQSLVDEKGYWEAFDEFARHNSVDLKKGFHSTRKRQDKWAKKAIQRELEPAIVHQWRKWQKYVYYQLEMRCVAMDVKGSAHVLKLHDKLSKILGKHHDLFVLEALVLHYLDSGTLKIEKCNLTKLIKHRNKILSQKLTKVHRQLVASESEAW